MSETPSILTEAQQQWRDRYVRRLMEHDFDADFALATFEAVELNDHDFDESPEDAADEELSNWTDDE